MERIFLSDPVFDAKQRSPSGGVGREPSRWPVAPVSRPPLGCYQPEFIDVLLDGSVVRL